jgi:Transposase IS66 family
VPFGKVSRILSTATELELNRSTLALAGQRLARKCWPTYARLILRLRRAAVTHVDETGWKVGRHSA